MEDTRNSGEKFTDGPLGDILWNDVRKANNLEMQDRKNSQLS